VTLAETRAQDGSDFGFEEAKSEHEVTSKQIGVGGLGQCRSVPPKDHHHDARDQTVPVAEHPHARSAMR
jgi:hypothetical protein